MRVTKAVDYALKACLYLASRDPGAGFTSVRKLCAILKLRRAYLLKVLKVLEDKKIVLIQRGAHGGYKLAVAPSTVSVRDLVEAVDGPVAISHLVENPREATSAVDQKILGCWKTIQNALVEKMQKVALTDLKPHELFKDH